LFDSHDAGNTNASHSRACALGSSQQGQSEYLQQPPLVAEFRCIPSSAEQQTAIFRRFTWSISATSLYLEMTCELQDGCDLALALMNRSSLK
jgi:hypothetical protein